MNEPEPTEPEPKFSTHLLAAWIAVSALMMWFSQPPIGLWPLTCVVLVPLIEIATGDTCRQGSQTKRQRRRRCLLLWFGAFAYWMISLQGLRFAHPLMILCLIAMAAYLAVYQLLFVVLTRRLIRDRSLTHLVWVVPVTWTALECIRNYFATGISVLMLGHALADVPQLIQIADTFGTYGVSFLIATVNAAAWLTWKWLVGRKDKDADSAQQNRLATSARAALVVAATLLIATLGYGHFRLSQPLGKELATYALIQRDEEIVYFHSAEREVELFDNYARESFAAQSLEKPLDVVVWPESMYTGANPWMITDSETTVPEAPEGPPISRAEFMQWVGQRREYFQQRSAYLQSQMQLESEGKGSAPDLLVGCGVVHYGERAKVHSGIVHIGDKGRVLDWYGKTHLVMFGEYIPILPWIPVLKSLVPEGLGVSVGPGAKSFDLGSHRTAGNICVETAVERVTVNHLRELSGTVGLPDTITTVTNDGWFDDSSVIEHHLRCAQLVAVGCRRPVLSAANNGPTAWIDSCGRIADRLPVGTNGSVIATPQQDPRTSPYLTLGDWPARCCVIVCAAILVIQRRRSRQDNQVPQA